MLCGRCGRQVYHAECKTAGNKCYHFFCFSCYRCRKLLDSCSVNTCNGELYCNACYRCFCNPCNVPETRPLKVCKKKVCCPCPNECCGLNDCCGSTVKSECCQKRCSSYVRNCCDPCDICCRPLRCVPCPDPCCSCCGRTPKVCCPPEPDNYCLRQTVPTRKCNPRYICLDDNEEPTCMGRSRSCSPCCAKPCCSKPCSAQPCCPKQCDPCNPCGAQPCCRKPCNPAPCCQKPCCRPCSPCSLRCSSPPACCTGCTACAAPAPHELAGYYSRNHEKCCCNDVCKGKCYCPDDCCCSKKNCCPNPPDCGACCAPYCPPPRKPICYPPRKCCEDPCEVPCERICYYPCKTPCHPKCCSCGLPNPCCCDPNLRRQLAIERNTPRCRRCGRKVYPAEKIMSSYGPYHTCCFSCYCCHKFLEVTNVFETHGEIYCKKCCTKYFGPQGYGYGSTLQSHL